MNSWLLGVLVFVIIIFCFLLLDLNYFKLLGSNYSKSESFCAVIPSFIIFIQIIPSLYFLYIMTSLDTSSDLSVKVVGHQWYWHYEYMDITDQDFDSFIKPCEDFFSGDLRILDVDNSLFLPIHLNVRFCFTGADVIHRWSLPSSGIKVDCSPGLLNCLTVNFPLVGLFYGQCREICGSNHSFIPVVVELTPWTFFYSWLLVS